MHLLVKDQHVNSAAEAKLTVLDLEAGRLTAVHGTSGLQSALIASGSLEQVGDFRVQWPRGMYTGGAADTSKTAKVPCIHDTTYQGSKSRASTSGTGDAML